MNNAIAAVVISLLAVVNCSAELAKVKGKGEVAYQGSFKQGSSDEIAAISKAKQDAITRYAAGLEPARFELYKKVEAEILAHIDDFVTDYTKLDEQVDTGSKRVTVIIEASVNTASIESLIQKSTAMQGAGSGEPTNLVFIFVARELASRKVFDAKRTSVEINEGSQAVNEKDAAAPDGQATQSAMATSSVAKKTVGGNTEIKADALSYSVSTVAAVDSAVNSVLTKARYETVDPNDAGLDVGKFKADFSAGNDVSAATRAEAIKILRQNGIRYMAIANMDVGLPEKDDVSGMTRVYVTVTAKITYLPPLPAEGDNSQPRKFPRTVASIAGKPYAGLGPDPEVARTNALNEAAEQSAIELTDQLRTKNIK